MVWWEYDKERDPSSVGEPIKRRGWARGGTCPNAALKPHLLEEDILSHDVYRDYEIFAFVTQATDVFPVHLGRRWFFCFSGGRFRIPSL